VLGSILVDAGIRVVHVSFGLRFVQVEDGAHCSETRCHAAVTWLFSPSLDLKHDIVRANKSSNTPFEATPCRITCTLRLDPLCSFLGTGLIAYINVPTRLFPMK